MTTQEQEKIMKDAQFRKAAPMAFLNARNSAIEIVKIEGNIPETKKTIKGKKVAKKQQSISERVEFHTKKLMQEYMEFYAKEVASVGVNFKPEDSIKKLKAATTLKELQKAWISLSQDERDNKEILKVAQTLRKKYND